MLLLVPSYYEFFWHRSVNWCNWRLFSRMFLGQMLTFWIVFKVSIFPIEILQQLRVRQTQLKRMHNRQHSHLNWKQYIYHLYTTINPYGESSTPQLYPYGLWAPKDMWIWFVYLTNSHSKSWHSTGITLIFHIGN